MYFLEHIFGKEFLEETWSKIYLGQDTDPDKNRLDPQHCCKLHKFTLDTSLCALLIKTRTVLALSFWLNRTCSFCNILKVQMYFLCSNSDLWLRWIQSPWCVLALPDSYRSAQDTHRPHYPAQIFLTCISHLNTSKILVCSYSCHCALFLQYVTTTFSILSTQEYNLIEH
jgi:hypothetical protein